MKDVEQVIVALVRTLVERRDGDVELELKHESSMITDIGLDSLELAELSAALEDELGRDPYSDGIVPRTIGELVGYYA